MPKTPPPSDAGEAGDGRPSPADRRVVDIDEAKLDRQRRATQARLKERKVSVSAQIRALKPGDSLMGIPPSGWDPDQEEFGLPPHCPVRPLGRDGDEFFFLNASGGVSTLSPSASGKAYIDALFAGHWMYLVWAWGRVTYTNKGPIYQPNYDAEKARVALFNAATFKGPWNMVDNVRGRGAWKGDAGELVLHVGNQLMVKLMDAGAVDLVVEPCGERKGKLYPMRPPTPRPAEAEQPAGIESAGREALRLLKSWNWSRGELDAKLMLGWILAAMIGGALDWRATVFVTGDKATGKSTLQKVVAALLGDALIGAVETTAAGIYQILKNDSLPVAVDELEADSDMRKAKAVIELARVASSGGRMLRGGQDHHGRQFDLRSPFFFSSINAPSLQPQDRSRMALLELKTLNRMVSGPSLDLGELRQMGTQLLRRVCDWWPRLDQLLLAFRRALMDETTGRHDGRGADTFGTLAAFAHIALSDDMPTEDELRQWARDLDARDLAEFESATPNWKLCLRHLLQAQPDSYRTYRHRSVGALLAAWKEATDKREADDEANIANLPRRLGNVGLGIVFSKGKKGSWDGSWLFVPNDHNQLNAIFQDTKWQGLRGSAGVWTGALRQAPQCAPIETEGKPGWSEGVYRIGTGDVGAMKLRGTLLRMESIFEAAGEAEGEDGEGS